jgi:aromatic ring-cleaving dioxygenase
MPLEQFHCHVYFTASEADRADALLTRIETELGLARGRFHTKPVGPHIDGSCQVLFSLAEFGTLVPWLMANRDGLTCFIHGDTGDDLVDHTDFVLWVGPEWDLDLDRFSKPKLAPTS